MESPPPQPQSQGDDAAETPTQKQARLRRERREAKFKSEGPSRLEKIAQVSGRQNLPEPPPNIGKVSDDPDEVDLSTHPSAARTPNPVSSQQQQLGYAGNGPPTEADIRAMLRSGAPQPGADGQTGTRRGAQGGMEGEGEEDDPMTKLLSQLVGGMPGGENSEGLPPGLAAMLGAGGLAAGGMGGGAQKSMQQDTYGYMWKIVHAVFALCLGVYVTATSTAFSGSIKRATPGAVLEAVPDREGMNLFFVFATVELVLQSSRFFLEKGNNAGQLGGWLGLAAGFLPEPYRGYLMLIGRYARIWGTVVEDAMVIVFVVGCVAWWKGAVG